MKLSDEDLVREFGEELAAEYIRVNKEARAVERRANQLKRKAEDGTISKAEQREYNRILSKGFNEVTMQLVELGDKLRAAKD